MTIPALAVEEVSHRYGARKALDDVSFTVKQGKFAALLGLNGAGKTTLFSLITRLYDTKSGQIAVLGHQIGRDPCAALRALGVVFQARTLDLDLSVRDNLLYHASLHGLRGRIARERAAEALSDVNLADRARDAARNLSGGQMRRVEIARALIHRPSLLVLDEPTVGLDVASRADIIAHVRRLVRERGVAVLWATHLLDEVEPEDHLVVLHQGKMLACDAASAVIAANRAASLGAAFAALTAAPARQAA
jgi:ABC-2 type transport system ATP-binding protein